MIAVRLSGKEVLLLLWAVIDSEPELCHVRNDMPPKHIARLRNLPREDMTDEDITRLYRKLADAFVG